MYSRFNEVEYIPNKITVGLFNYKCKSINNIVNAAYVSWKDPKGKWRSPSIFERLCGYKPHKQLDATKELTKTIKNCVIEYDNVPIKLLKIISWNEDVYLRNNTNNPGVYTWDVLLEDPRGFVIGITNDEFFELLKYSGWNLKDGILNVEVVYSSRSYSSLLTLLPISHNKYQEIADKSKKLFEKEKDKTTYITKSQLQVGHVYKAADDAPIDRGEYMYLGIHDTYSLRCHINAVRTGKYNIEEYINKEKRNTEIWRQTTKGRMIFYKINSSEKAWNNYDALFNPNTIYLTRPNISKYFIAEVELDKNAKMYNDPTKPLTCENVLADMEKTLIFNKIKLLESDSVIDNIYCRYKPMTYDTFEVLYGYSNLTHRPHSNKEYIPHYYPKPCSPFNLPVKTNLYYRDLTHISISTVDEKHKSLIDKGELNYSTRNAKYDNYSYRYSVKSDKDKATFIDIYNTLKPQIPDLTLESGYKVYDELATIFIPSYPDRTYEFGY